MCGTGGARRRKVSARGLGALLLLAAAARLAGPAAAEPRSVRTITIFNGRRIATSVPAGWTFADSVDKHSGVHTIVMRDQTGEMDLSVSFLPDTAGRFPTEAAVESELRKVSASYVSGSVEQGITIVPLGAVEGLGASASFTDRMLVGKPIPPTEKLHSTVGIRAWKGAYLFFTLLSNARDTAQYRTALDVVRTGIVEVARKSQEKL